MKTPHRLMRGMAVATSARAATLSAPAMAAAHEARPTTGADAGTGTSAGAGTGTGTGTGTFQECRGKTVDKSAPVIARATVLIKAPLRTAWDLHTDIDAWDTWTPVRTTAEAGTATGRTGRTGR